MPTKTYDSYEEATQEYLTLFDQLLKMPEKVDPAPRRAAADIPAEMLIERADEIAKVSAGIVPLSRDYLEASDLTVRQGISGQLIAQAAAELQLATELLQVAEGEKEGPPLPTTRAARGQALREAVNALESSMKVPVSQGLVSSDHVRRAPAPVPNTLTEAKKSLQTTAVRSAGSIAERVREFGGDVAWDLVLNTEWTAILNGAALLREDIAEKLDAVKEGAGTLVSRAVTTASKTLLNVYDKIMALLGKDAKDQARQKIKEWLEKIEKEKKIDLFEKLVDKLYGVDAFRKDLEEWLANTTAGKQVVHNTTEAVSAISDQFIVLVGRMKLLEDVVGLAKLVKVPQVLLIVTSIRIALLAVLVYAGSDYIGYKEPPFPDITKGVAKVIQENLVVQA